MQEASGADFTDRNWSAQPSSDDLATHDLATQYGLHSPSVVLFNRPLQMLARHTVAVGRRAVTRGFASRPGCCAVSTPALARCRQAARSFLLVDL